MTVEASIVPVDYELRIGDSMVIEIQALDENDDPVDLTSATIEWRLADKPAGTVVLTYVTPTDVVITDALNGIFEVIIKKVDTANLTAGVSYWEARVFKGLDARLVAKGYFRILQPLT